MKTLILTMLAGLSLATLPAAAQALADPTRPPQAQGAGRPGAAALGQPRLQSVLFSPRAGGRQVAVIDGETVRVGERFRGARVSRIGQAEVELVRGSERQVLRLDPPDAAAPVPAGPAAPQ